MTASLLGGHSELDPPDPIPNSEVKRFSADDSVGLPHVKVGHRQALYLKYPTHRAGYFFALPIIPLAHCIAFFASIVKADVRVAHFVRKAGFPPHPIRRSGGLQEPQL
jgi:hypothetical protein